LCEGGLPHCHLIVLRTLFEMPLFFLSIAGAPAAGQCRKLLAEMVPSN
jgi:hypothetical protein